MGKAEDDQVAREQERNRLAAAEQLKQEREERARVIERQLEAERRQAEINRRNQR